MATLDQLSAALVKADAAGNTDDARVLAAEIRKMRQAPDTTYNPTEGMSTFDKAAAGFGKAIVDTGRGIGQFVGLTDRADVAESRKRDAALMGTGAGQVGNFAGNLSMMLPALAIPGAATLPGAAAIGAAQGLMQPSVSTGETIQNTLLGGAASAGGIALGRGAGAAYQGGKALIEPFSQGGREKIAGRMIQRFAQDPASIASTTGQKSITGALPTLAEQTGDAGLARLQDSLRSVDPQIGNQIGQRLADNNAARVNSLQSLTGQDGGREFAVQMRAGTTKPMYDSAFGIIPDAASMTAEQSRTIQTLMRSPAVQSAMKDAQEIAKNSGKNVGPANATGSVEGLHNMKLALDDAYQTAKASGNSNKATSIKDAQSRLVGFMEDLSPDYRQARTTYADMSKPINQMDIAAQIANKATSNTSDLAGNSRMQANALLGMLRDEPGLIKKATGGKSSVNALADILSPDQLSLIRSVASETDRAAAVATAGNGPGSATAQRMASQNILRQLVGPTGLPASWAESALANTVIGKPFNLVYGGVAEPKIQQALAEAVLNPDVAKRMLQAGQNSPRLPQNQLTQLLSNTAKLVPSTLATTQGR